MRQRWLFLNSDSFRIEKQQLVDEGKDLTGIEKALDEAIALLANEDEMSHQEKAKALLDRTMDLPTRADYAYNEPSTLAEIQAARPHRPHKWTVDWDDPSFYDRMLGAWLGRCSGCLLGKPVEGWRSARMWGYLKALDRYPLADYFRSDIPRPIAQKYDVSPQRPFIDRVDHMVEDDDTNYTVTSLAIAGKHGLSFTPEDVAVFWMEHIPILHTFTAERVAYRNFIQNIPPPASARFRNPHREWIGAQIRADFWGYVALGNPERAAELAWRDACISHVKNGIYGAMWVAAMIAAAPFVEELTGLIRVGLAEIPQVCRLAEEIAQMVTWYKAGVDYEEVVARLHKRWDEHSFHHWCHTISNAQIVAIGLLWGEDDYEKSICRAVQACFDTDCNGATVGSIIGLRQGAQRLPGKWIAPLNDTLDTGIAGYHRVHISDLAKESLVLAKDWSESFRGQRPGKCV